ncbi:hypothetical protein PV08_02269 [Exophiala spinifera]|uniref:Rhodopsin domain-containing protein n=1 Tax=Exophiala spinifera TaxID=91928 RepID=A0A0D2BG95_9EURO|nr:uncharacterized protein PV08_02269 [Exophiala spinifera]KIW17983.1 hypothetical protein PV08_02269 [Exophiala spinifera]
MTISLHLPPEVLATWPTPNYINPPTRGPGLEVVSILFSIVGLAVVATRIYSRLLITRAPGWDDFLIVVGLAFSIAASVMTTIGNKLYFSGRHIWDVPPSTFTPLRLNVWITEWLVVLAGTAIKISVLLFYRRLSVKFPRGFLIATWVGIVYMILYVLAFTLTLLLICRPTDSYWNSFTPNWAATHKFHCADQSVSIPSAVGLSVLGDFYTTILPLLLIYRLKLPLKQKLALYSLFALGFLACIFGVIRLVLLNKLLNDTFDFTWLLWEMWIWSVVELYVAIFAASAPALKPFLQRFLSISTNGIARISRQLHVDKGLPVPTFRFGSHSLSNMTGSSEADVESVGGANIGGERGVRGRGFWRDQGHRIIHHFHKRPSQGHQITSAHVTEQNSASAFHRPSSKPENWSSKVTTLDKPLPLPPTSKT